MPTTTNFGWTTPADTDLVKDGAGAIRTLAGNIDTSLVDLKGGTTGQVLSKTSNTDLDFTWVAPTAGDIEGVTAGTGISGGGTSGTVTITNDMATTITAAGDIIVGTGSGTYDNLPIGTTGQILTADTSVSPYKVKWETPAGGGKVLQVVQDTLVGQISTTSGGSYVDTGLEVTITPSSASSKILVMSSCMQVTKAAGYSNACGDIALFRNGSEILAVGGERIAYTNSTTLNSVGSVTWNYLDSPATTSAVTYKVRYFTNVSAAPFYINYYDGTNDVTSTIIVMEIGA